MKHLLTFIVLFISIAVIGQTNSSHVKVNGHVKQNGTYVAPHARTAPNSTNTDNFSTKPNVNPYTGTQGHIQPDNNSLPSPVFQNSTPSANTKDGTDVQKTGLEDFFAEHNRKNEEYKNYRFPAIIIRKSDGVKCYLVDEDHAVGKYEYNTKYGPVNFSIDKYHVKYQIRFYSNLPTVFSEANAIQTDVNQSYSQQFDDTQTDNITEQLTYLGYSNTIDSIKQFQRENGLTPDGKIGPNTKKALNKAVEKKQRE